MKKRIQYLLTIILFILTLCSAVKGVTSIIGQNKTEVLTDEAKVIAQDLKEKLEVRVQAVSAVINNVVQELNDGALVIGAKDSAAGQTLEARLKHDLGLVENLYELGFALEPAQACTERRLYAKAYRVKEGGVSIICTDELEDYVPERDTVAACAMDKSERRGNWFAAMLGAEEGIWMEPAVNRVTATLHVRYGRPFRVDFADNSLPTRGVVYAVWDIKGVSGLLKRAATGPNGYANLRTKNGAFLVHYNWDYVFGSYAKNTKESPAISKGNPAGIYTVTIAGTLWELNIKKDSTSNFEEKRRSAWNRILIVHICILTAVFILFLSRLIFRRNDTRAKDLARLDHMDMLLNIPAPDGTDNAIPLRWRILVWAASILLLSASVSLLATYYIWPNAPELVNHITRVDNKHRFNAFWRQHQETVYMDCQRLPIAVPTGIFIQSMTFVNAKEIQMTGHIWQKYTAGIHDGISRGFILPESEETTIDHLYTQKTGDEELWGWRFSVVVNQEFDYLHYPFGCEDIWIQMWHKDFYSNVVLIPDYDSYKLILPCMKPGIRESLEMPGWNVKSTFFGYLIKNYETSFGIPSFDGLTEFPELYFNVIIEKQIIAPLVSYLLPVVFIWVMLFAILLLSSRYKAQAESYGFNAMNVVAACAGFFLVVVFCHVDLRHQIVSKDINYLEYYYFIAYALIVFVIANALILTLSRFEAVHYKNNLIPKVLYWPTLGCVIFILTLRTFY